MEQTNIITPEPSPAPRPSWTYFLLPGAILIAAVLLSGKVYIPGLTAKIADAQPKTGTIQYTVEDIKTWAKKVKGLNRSDFNACIDSGKYADRIESDRQSGAALGVQGTPSFFINGAILEGAQPIEAFRQAIAAAVPGKNEVRTDDHVKGDANAPVAIIEYSDFQCPYCRKFYEDTLPTLIKEYVDTGKAKLVYRHFPLEFHPAALVSAQASECAAEQGKFWEMHDAIFTEQAK